MQGRGEEEEGRGRGGGRGLEGRGNRQAGGCVNTQDGVESEGG